MEEVESAKIGHSLSITVHIELDFVHLDYLVKKKTGKTISRILSASTEVLASNHSSRDPVAGILKQPLGGTAENCIASPRSCFG